MNAVQSEVLPADPIDVSHRVARGIGTFFFVGCVLFVLFAGTFPFDFRIPSSGAGHQIASSFDWRPNPWDPGHQDRKQNIKFFLPFGFCIASLIGWPSRRRRSSRALLRILVALAAGAALSSFVEVCQTFVSFRDPSFADVWCNTVGSLFGAAAFVVIGEPGLKLAARVLLRLRPLAKPSILGAAVVAYAAFQLAAPTRLVRNPGDLSIWDPGASLILGNSYNGESPWNGTVSDFVLADRAIEPEQATELARGAPPADIFGESLLAEYAPCGQDPYPDRTHQINSPLIWAHSQRPVDLLSNGPPPLHQGQWLRTTAGLAPAIHRIGKTSQLTLALTATSFDPQQRRPDAAPVTIAAIAADWNALNFLVSQDRNDLVIRVRTAVRGMPLLYLRNVFADTNAHHIAVAVRQAQIVVYVDGIEHGRCEITPEAKMIWRLYPRVGFRLWLDRYGFRSYAAIYRALVFIPFAMLLGAALAMSDLNIHTKRFFGIGATVVMALLLESILGSESASGFQVRNLIISLAIGLGTLGVLAWWKRDRSTAL